MSVSVCVYSVAQSYLTLCDLRDDKLPGSLSMGLFQNTGVGCHFLLQGIFLTQGLKLCTIVLFCCPSSAPPVALKGIFQWSMPQRAMGSLG